MRLILDVDHDLVFDAELASPGNEMIRIKAGSEASMTALKADGDEYVDRSESLRNRLMREGILVRYLRTPEKLIFTRDHVFETPGAAAEVILGRNLSARRKWCDAASGKSLFDLFGASR